MSQPIVCKGCGGEIKSQYIEVKYTDGRTFMYHPACYRFEKPKTFTERLAGLWGKMLFASWLLVLVNLANIALGATELFTLIWVAVLLISVGIAIISAIALIAKIATRKQS